jgi:hypothetical protein
MSIDIAEWLHGLGLAQYAEAFDWEVLPKLTSDDLREIGVAAVGHRRKLLEAIAALREVASAGTVNRPPSSATAAAPRVEESERRQLTPGSAATRVATPKPAIFSSRSMAGSPKASTRPI